MSGCCDHPLCPSSCPHRECDGESRECTGHVDRDPCDGPCTRTY